MIIDTASECTVSQLMKCWFDNKLSVLVIDGDFTEDEMKQAFEAIHTEYIDLAGLYKSKEFELLSQVNHIETRVNRLTMSIDLQRRFLKEFDIPFVTGLATFKEYGHNIYWDSASQDKTAFLSALNKIEQKTKLHKMQLIEKRDELLMLQKNKIEKNHTVIQSRREFIRTLNAINKFGFDVKKNETTVEELALMINDWQKEIIQNNKSKK